MVKFLVEIDEEYPVPCDYIQIDTDAKDSGKEGGKKEGEKQEEEKKSEKKK